MTTMYKEWVFESHVFETQSAYLGWFYGLFQKFFVPLHREFTHVLQSVDCFDL
jgi:hypothetical protein